MKKLISLVCAVTLLLTQFCVGGISFAFAETEVDGMDFNGDGAVNNTDVRRMLQQVVAA